MAISTTAASIILLGNGATSVFSIPFIMDEAADIEAIYTDADGTPTTLLSSQYSLFINPPGAGQLWGVGGQITYPLSGSPIASGTSLTVNRVIPLLQTTVISGQGAFSAEVTETGLDILEMQIQQVAARTGQQRGTWATATDYNFGDVVKDGANGANTGSYYMCSASNTSTVWATDLAAGDWTLIIQATIPAASLPLSIGNGGTGAITAVAALANLGAISLRGNNAYTGANDFTLGSIAVPTAGAGDSSSKAASTAFVNGTALTLAAGTTTHELTGSGVYTASAFIPTSAAAPANGMYLPAANTVGFAANSFLALQLSATASAANRIQIQTTGNGTAPIISAIGDSDTNISITYETKGTGQHFFCTNGSSASIGFAVNHVASQINYVAVSGSASGAGICSLIATGGDTNIDIVLTPKGSGNVKFGTYTNTPIANTGYITIRDAGGTLRKVMVGA